MALVTALIGVVLGRLNVGNISMLYLLVVLPVAVYAGSRPAIFASVAAFLAFDWFHVQPVHTFTAAGVEEWGALFLFLLVSSVTGELAADAAPAGGGGRPAGAGGAGAARAGAHPERERRDRRRAAGGGGPALRRARPGRLRRAAAGGRGARRAGGGAGGGRGAAAGGGAVDGGVDGGPGALGERHRPRAALGARPPAAARGGARRRPTGSASCPSKRPSARWGCCAWRSARTRAAWSEEDARLVDAAADQIALAVERSRLRQEALAAEVLRQGESARKALLASVSHDLRTPLASIKASADSLVQDDVTWTEGERRGFAVAIEQEADRLNRLVENLLDASRIEAGALRPDPGLVPAGGAGGRRAGAARVT